MAGLGWKQFNSAEVLTAANLQGYAVDQSTMVFATSAARDAAITAPSQGMNCFLSDSGVMQTYFSLYNSSTNVGGRETAGWYTNTRSNGLVPIMIPSVTIATGSGSANSMGVVTFTGATSIKLNNVFSATYANYKLVMDITTGAATDDIIMQMKMDGAGATSYFHSQIRQFASTVDASSTASTSSFSLGITGRSTVAGSSFDVTIFKPFVAANTKYNCHNGGNSTVAGQQQQILVRGRLNDTTSYATMELLPSSSTISGTLSVFGYNS